MGLAEERAVVLGVAAEPANFGPQFLDDPTALAGALAEQLLEPVGTLDVGGRVFKAGDAVDQGRGQRVEAAVSVEWS